MRAVQLIAVGEPLVDVEVPVRPPGSDEVVVAVGAAGICRSDLHYRQGEPAAPPVPIVLGHEIAGVVVECGPMVYGWEPGDRVAVHYQLSCGVCDRCRRGGEQFCRRGSMIGNTRDGGFAEKVLVPARNLLAMPGSVPVEHGAVMMCAAATAFHALRKARLTVGESVAVFGVGGVGVSAVQLARASGASTVFGVDLNTAKLEVAGSLGAVPIDARDDPVSAIRHATGGDGVDVSLELIGSGTVFRQAIDVLAPFGRSVAVGLTGEATPIRPYRDLVLGEIEAMGASDHLYTELLSLMSMAAGGLFDPSVLVSRTIPLEAGAVNGAIDDLAAFEDAVRTVIVP